MEKENTSTTHKMFSEKEMKKLSRAVLLEMLIDQSVELQTLRERLTTAENALQQREIAIKNAGSIAEASLQLNGIFESAQAASQQYMDNIQLLSERQEAICQQFEIESKEKANRRIEEAERKSTAMESEIKSKCAAMESETITKCTTMESETKSKCAAMESETKSKCAVMESETISKCSKMESETKSKCDDMLAKAKAESQSYWDEIISKLDDYCAEHKAVRDLLSIVLTKREQE